MPVVYEGRCSCYFWNLGSMKIHVLDPLMMRCSPTSVQRRHGQNVTIINEAISRCKDTFFQGWSVNMNGWDRCFTVGLGTSCHRWAVLHTVILLTHSNQFPLLVLYWPVFSCQIYFRNNSGLFAAHYARAFDGHQLLWELKTVNKQIKSVIAYFHLV